MASDYNALPDNLPAPVDDGAAAHLTGLVLPAIALPATDGSIVHLDQLPDEWTVLYAYPMTGVPGVALPEGWNEIPGARGCTPQACGFRDIYQEFRALNAQVYGLSTQTTGYQRELAERVHLPFAMLSDADFKLTGALNLPTFEVEGRRLLRRLTLFLRQGRIEHVLYPVFPPDKSAEQALTWLRTGAP